MKIKKLTINKMPGFPYGMPPFRSFAANVNIIAGVNGSGKSSMAKAIRKLIWFDKNTTNYSIEALIDVRNTTNHVEIEPKTYTRTHQGQKTTNDFAFIAPSEFSDQYMLALHNLVTDDDAPLAAQIAREINGGIDPDKAAATLQYRPVKPTLANQAYRAYREATQHYKDVEAQQQDLKTREQTLENLYQEKEKTEEAATLAELYRRTLKYLTARKDFDQAEANANRFSSLMEKVQESDSRTMESLERKIGAANQQIAFMSTSVDNDFDKIYIPLIIGIIIMAAVMGFLMMEEVYVLAAIMLVCAGMIIFVIRDWKKSINAHNKKQQEIDKVIAGFEAEKQQARKEMEQIYSRVGIDNGNKYLLTTLTNKYDRWKIAKSNLEKASILLNAAQIELAELPLYAEKQEILISKSQYELENMMHEAQTQSGTFENTVRNIAVIETSIERHQKRSDVEQAIANQQEARDKLHQDLAQNLRTMTGSLILEHLKYEISLNNDNPVFRKANSILSAITRARYSLTISEGSQPAFCALDNVESRTLTLDEVSTGTRVQLLLAIRLAYIESQENIVRLPIIADELLANSDDQRSEAIIQALIEISRTRQVFYLTAQADEVAKWKHYLNESPDIEYDIVLLGNALPEMHANPIQITPVKLIRQVEQPNGRTHAAYRQAIRVAPYDITTQLPGELHLWYLVDNVDVLYNCLRCGIERWGQLNSYLQNGGRIEGLTAGDVFTIRQLVQLLQRVGELYNYGRPRPIDRDVLIRSGAVTDVYLDKTAELLAIGNYNPDTLIDALDAGAVKGFRLNKKEELRQYLLDNNYISANRPYDEEEIKLKLAAFVSNLEIDSAAAQQFLNNMFIINSHHECCNST